MLSSVFGGAAGVDLLLVVSRGHVGTGSPCYAGTTKSRYTPVFRILRIDLRIRPVDRTVTPSRPARHSANWLSSCQALIRAQRAPL